MESKKSLNQKRLTKKEVQKLIADEGKLHKEYTGFFEETYGTGYVKRDKVYELSQDRFLYVFDENGLLDKGKGDIYPKDYFLRFIKWVQRVRDDSKNLRGDSVSHWQFYSKYKSKILGHIDELITELSDKLAIDQNKLDKSYKSLDIVSEHCEIYGLDKAIENLYDNLVIYIGEVIKGRINGHWEIQEEFSGGGYPFISVGLKDVQHMAIDAVWSALSGLEKINFRKETVAEIRSKAFDVKFYRGDFSKSL